MRFLIVDDSKAIQAIVRRALHKLGLADIEYRAASDGIEALKVMDDWQPDIVLTDWHMPGMSGIELLKAVRNRGWSALKVGFITTESAPANLEEARQLGAVFVINKPFQDDDLVRLVRSALDAAPAATPEPAGLAVAIADATAVASALATALDGKLAVLELPAEGADEIHLPSAVALFVHPGTSEIRALCLLDFRGIVLLGGTSASRVLPDIARLMEGKDVPADVWEHMLTALGEIVPPLFLASDGARLKVLKTQLLRQSPDQLREIMRRSPSRRDFSLTRGKLPPGQLTLISK